MAEKITSRSENYSDWYINIVTQAKLADYGPVKGCMVIRPRGFAIWEKMQSVLDQMFKDTGHENAYFPLLIPQEFMHREAEHVEGFAPELAVVTHGGGRELEEPLVIRPTSETIIWSMYKKWIQSYRDLPLLINQWANVLRWEKRTRLFLRTSEFLWQEGHTAHATSEEAEQEAQTILNVYKTFAEKYMALPVLTGIKSESEKFAGAVSTYSIEAMMQDRKALQAGTSHFLGQNFARAFDVSFQNKEGQLDYVWASSWGVSTRLIGALIMAHSDDNGLVLPPKLAPIQVVIVPIFRSKNKSEILAYAEKFLAKIRTEYGKAVAVVLDSNEQNSPGWKFAEYELQGIPIRIEIGPRDMENHKIMLVRRDSSEKSAMDFFEAVKKIPAILEDIQQSLFERAKIFRDKNNQEVSNYGEFKEFFSGDGGFAIAPWNGDATIEERVKTETKASIRVLLEKESVKGRTCIFSGEAAKYMAVFAKSY